MLSALPPPEGRAGRHAEPPPAEHRSHRRLRRHRRPGAPQDRPCPRAGRRDDCERGQGSDGARLCLLRLSPQLAWFAAPLMQVLDERKARGIADTVGRDASPRLRQPRQHTRGAELLEKLSGAPADAAVALRHLPAPGPHGRPAPPDDGNRKRAERRRRPPFCTQHADARQSELHGGARRGCKAMPARRMVSTARGGRRDFRSRVP